MSNQNKSLRNGGAKATLPAKPADEAQEGSEVQSETTSVENTGEQQAPVEQGDAIANADANAGAEKEIPAEEVVNQESADTAGTEVKVAEGEEAAAKLEESKDENSAVGKGELVNEDEAAQQDAEKELDDATKAASGDEAPLEETAQKGTPGYAEPTPGVGDVDQVEVIVPINEAQAPVAEEAAEEETEVAVEDNTNHAVLAVRDRLTQYLTNMKPGKPQTATSGATNQLILWRIINFILRQRGEDFTLAMDEFLDTVKKNSGDNGVFNEFYAFRFFDNISISGKDRANFNALLHTFITLADKGTRNAKLKSIDPLKAFAGVTDSTSNSLVAEYFTPRI